MAFWFSVTWSSSSSSALCLFGFCCVRWSFSNFAERKNAILVSDIEYSNQAIRHTSTLKIEQKKKHNQQQHGTKKRRISNHLRCVATYLIYSILILSLFLSLSLARPFFLTISVRLLFVQNLSTPFKLDIRSPSVSTFWHDSDDIFISYYQLQLHSTRKGVASFTCQCSHSFQYNCVLNNVCRPVAVAHCTITQSFGSIRSFAVKSFDFQRFALMQFSYLMTRNSTPHQIIMKLFWL